MAGYSLIFAAHQAFLETERFESHEQLVNSLAIGLRDGQLTLPLPQGLGVEAQLTSGDPLSPTQTTTTFDGSHWLISRTPLTLIGGQAVVLEVRQHISQSVEHVQRDSLLLILASGASALVTSVLLRLVIWRGVTQPLRGFTRELQLLEADSLGNHLLDPATQPSEFRPIVDAFNHLQGRLAAAWQRERRFVDGVAHELRTPITVIFAHAQRLQVDASQSSSGSVAVIVAEAKRLGDLTSVMLDFARVDAGRLALLRDELDLEAVLLDAFERLQGLAPDRLQLAPFVEDDLPRIRADVDRVHQCLAALVENALRYSEGFVQLEVSASPTGVTLHVRDQGPGIPVSERDQVLQRFVRGSTASGTQGSGLGLAIVNDLMRAMHGELLISDGPGGGADLQLRFKLSDRPPAP